ncbi:SMC-Scp complex subunit ScpB [Candidatus Parcubacteria bacterium]|nr:SMC-Scp complex subunit ScpB [Candidatus Parcubacteria bacterium]
MVMDELAASLEAVLFAAGEPVTLARLVAATEADQTAVTGALAGLKTQLRHRGIRLVTSGRHYSLATAPQAAAAVGRYLGGGARAELSKPALETLAIVAYRQPLTRTQIEQIRGVSSDQTIKNLLLRGLIIESGRADSPGKPLLYATSVKFLEHFGLSSPAELPPLDQPAAGRRSSPA